MSFAQGAPTQNLSIVASNVFLYGSSTAGNAFTVQQLGVGNVASFQTSTGASALFINPSGYVGFGTATPQYRLHVVNPGPLSNIVIETDTNAIGQRSEIRFGIPAFSGTSKRAGITSNTYVSDGSDLQFWTNASSGAASTPQMTILPSGFVGIGNTTPQARIWVPATSTTTGIAVYNADVAMIFGNTGGSSNSNTGSIQIKAGGSATGIGTSNYHLTLNPDGGSVGVGVPTGTALQAKFHVEQGQMFIGNSAYAWGGATESATSSGYNIRFDNTYNGTVGTGTICNKISLYNVPTWQAGFSIETSTLVYHSGAIHSWYTGTTGSAYGTQRMTLTSAGSLGIGTASPAYRHHVYNGDTSVSYYGPNATWGAYLMVGAGGNYSASQRAQVMCSNGNLHIDCGQGAYQIYLNYYQGGGNGGTNATVGCYAAFTATGDITAFSSDERLKTKVGLIENALDKVCSLTAFKYIHNETARQNGFTDDNVYVGLSAQEVQKVLPEVVKPAPFDQGTEYDVGKGKSKSGENYLTIQYERVVSLLVEALKEERAERLKVDERLARLEKLLIKE